MSRRTRFLIPILLAIVPSIVFWEVFRGDVLLPTDWVYQDMEPWRRLGQPDSVVNPRLKDAVLIGASLDAVSARAAADGDVLLWNRFAGGGTPHMASGFTRMLYPPFWMRAVLPENTGHSVDVLLHLFLTSWFAYLFLRRVGANVEGAFLGGVVYGLTPSIIHRAEMSFHLPTMVWFPLMLYCIESLVATGRRRYAAGLAITVALQLTAGHFPDMLIQFLGAGAYGVVRAWTSSTLATGFERVAWCASGAALGGALAAPFLLPALELVAQANRPVSSASGLASSGLGWDVLLTLFTPWKLRSALFVGLAPLVFVPLAFRAMTRSVAWSLLAVCLTGVLVAAGTPVLVVLQALIPPVKNLRYVHTLVSVGSFGLALLAGLGLSEFFRQQSKLVTWLARILLAVVVIAALARPELATAWHLPVTIASLSVLVIALELCARRRRAARVAVALVLLSATIELGHYARSINPRIDASTFPLFPELESIQFLREDPDLFRVGPLPYQQAPFWPNTLGAYGIEDVGVYHSIFPASLGRYMERLHLYAGGWRRADIVEDRDSAGNWMSLPDYRPSNLLRIWNIKYFATPAGWDNPDPGTLELVHDADVRIFRLKNWLPRVWLVGDPVVVPGERGAYAKLLDPSFDPERAVVLEQEPTCFYTHTGRPVAAGTDPSVTVVDYGAERVQLSTSSPRAGILFLSQSYDPGWKADVNGQPAPVLRANANFQAIALGPGAHDVVLRYEPESYWWGWLGALFGLVVCAWLAGPLLDAGALRWFSSALCFVPLGVAVFGWQAELGRDESASCGQLRVTSRYSSNMEGEPAFRPNGTALGHAIDTPGSWRWAIEAERQAMLRVWLAGDVSWTLRAPPNGSVPLASGTIPSPRRWHARSVPLTPGAHDLELETQATGTLIVGTPMVLEPGPRTTSTVIFQLGGDDAMPGDAVVPGERSRVLLTLGDVAPANVSAFDEVYPSSDTELSRRLLAMAPELYRIATVLVVRVEPTRADFGARQAELLRAELERLGIRDDDVEIRVVRE